MLDETIGDTLALVNIAREAFGAPALSELPDAKPGDSRDCLYYRALRDIGVENVGAGSMTFRNERQASVVASLWGTSADGVTVQSPANVRSVISAFDNGRTSRYNV